MRNRTLILLTSLAVVLAACSSPEGGATIPTTQADVPDEVLLTYELRDGASFVYDVMLEQGFVVDAEGTGSSLGGEEMPGAADVTLTGSGQFTFDVADGAEAGTFDVTITGEIGDLVVSGEVDGDPVSGEDVPDFAEMEPISATITVDEQGNVIPQGPSVDDPFTGMLGGLGSPGGLGPNSIPGLELGQFFGPPLEGEPVSVGDTWSTSFDTPGFGAESITTTVDGEVSGTDNVNGTDVYVIDTHTRVSAFSVDLAEFFIGLFGGFLPDDASPEERAQLANLVDNLRFVISSDESTSTARTLFDPESGHALVHEVSSLANLRFDINFPDEETGDLSSFLMDMSVEQKATYTLVSASSA